MGFCPLVICVTHDGSFHSTVQAFHKTIGCRVVRGCSADVYATNLCKAVDELGFELASVVGGDGLWTTKTGNPSREQSAGHCFCCDVWNCYCFWPACETVDGSEAILKSCRERKLSNQVDVDVSKAGSRKGEVANWGDSVL